MFTLWHVSLILKGSSYGRMVDQNVLRKLEAAFKKLENANDSNSLLKKYLTWDVFNKLKYRKTTLGVTLLDVIQSGIAHLNSDVGIYAPDPDSYNVFAELFNPVIEDYHGGFKPKDRHPLSDFGDVDTLQNLDPTGEYIVSTRIRFARNLEGYPFNPCLTEGNYKEIEQKISAALTSLHGEAKGTYYSLIDMDKQTKKKLVDDHFLFKEEDKCLQAANAYRYWPAGRGIFYNDEMTFLVWVNEEDHVKIISMERGSDLRTVFKRLVHGLKEIESKLPFIWEDRLGYMTFCPTNLGTTMRASVFVALPKLAQNKAELESAAAKFHLQIRGTRGEHSVGEGGLFDISNKRRLGLTEYQVLREFQHGVLEVIKMEKHAVE